MIEKLTQEQEAMIPKYVKDYVAIGLNNDRIDEKQLAIDVENFYSEFFKKNLNPKIIVRDSPLACWKFICNKIGKRIEFVFPYNTGSFDSNIFAFYNYFKNVVGIRYGKVEKKYEVWSAMVNYGMMWPFDDYCIVSQKPSKIQRKGEVVHCDGGPAIEYADGFMVYILNGVRVPKEYAVKPWNELDPRLIQKETNAEIRRELVRKIGIERICEHLNADVLDTKDDYELLNLDIGDGNKRPYLKMKNPSIGVYHIEGVHPNCKTVDDALKFRNGTSEEPLTIT